MSYFETSAKTGFNVEDVFATSAKDAYFKEAKERHSSEAEELRLRSLDKKPVA